MYQVKVSAEKLMGISRISSDLFIKLCENIGIFIKNYKSTIPGSNKVVYMDPMNKKPKKKLKI